MLNQAVAGLGQSFLQNRAMQQRATEAELDRQMKQQLMDEQVAQRREATQARQSFYNARQTEADANAKARQDAADAAKQKQVLADKQEWLKNVIQLNAGGQLKNLDTVNQALANDEHWGPTGIQLQAPPQKAPPQVGQNSIAAGLDYVNKLEAQAAAVKDSDPETYARLKKQIGILTDSMDPSAFQNVTEEQVDPTTGKVTSRKTYKQRVGGQAAPAPLSPEGFQNWLGTRNNITGGPVGPGPFTADNPGPLGPTTGGLALPQ